MNQAQVNQLKFMIKLLSEALSIVDCSDVTINHLVSELVKVSNNLKTDVK